MTSKHRGQDRLSPDPPQHSRARTFLLAGFVDAGFAFEAGFDRGLPLLAGACWTPLAHPFPLSSIICFTFLVAPLLGAAAFFEAGLEAGAFFVAAAFAFDVGVVPVTA